MRCSLTVRLPMKRSCWGMNPAMEVMALAFILMPFAYLSPDTYCWSCQSEIRIIELAVLSLLTSSPSMFWKTREWNRVLFPAAAGPITATSSPFLAYPLTAVGT